MTEYIQIAYDRRHAPFINELQQKFAECGVEGEGKLEPAGLDEQDGMWWRHRPADQLQMDAVESLVEFIAKNTNGDHIAFWKENK